jgi:hypothetical protein
MSIKSQKLCASMNWSLAKYCDRRGEADHHRTKAEEVSQGAATEPCHGSIDDAGQASIAAIRY